MAERVAPTRTAEMGKPVEPHLLDRIKQGVRYMLTGQGPSSWMGPGQPLAPVAQEEARGRRFDYPSQVNTQQTPRSTEGVSFPEMRALADGYDLLRLVIETRKDQVAKMGFDFGLKPEIAEKKKATEARNKALKQQKEAEAKAAEPPPVPEVDELTGLPKPPKPEAPKVKIPEVPAEDPRIAQLRDFFAYPDQENDWDTWLRALLEDLFVIDAPAIYPRPTLDEGLYALELVDGGTITRKINADGRTPLPPDPAYQQVIKGMPAVDYSRDELIYKPRNVRTNRIYGYSPVEQIIMTVNIAMRRQISQLQAYTEGNVPEALLGVPPEWSAADVEQFQGYWDTLAGDSAMRRRAKFVPGGTTYIPTRESPLKDMFDEWLARIICYAFSLSPQALIKETNRSVAETMHQAALEEGLAPIMKWIKSLIDYIIVKYFGFTDLEFKWQEENDQNPKDQAEILAKLVEKKIITDDEAREDLGKDPYTPEQRDQMKAAAPPMLPGGLPLAGAAAATANAQAVGGTEKPVGKLQSSGLRKAKSLSRNRASNKACTKAVASTMSAALNALKKQCAKALDGELSKAASISSRVRKILASIDMDALDASSKKLGTSLAVMFADGATEGLEQVLRKPDREMFKQVNKLSVVYAEERSAELVTQIGESTRDMLRSTVTEAIEGGWSNDRLAAELESAYAFSPERAEMIARTETAYADVAGNLAGWHESGVVEKKQWIVAQDEFCDLCEELADVIVDLGEEFPGEGGDGPPLHPNCRCDVIPLVN